MNEYYARETSRKIRSTFQSKGKSGKHLTGTVIYGYRGGHCKGSVRPCQQFTAERADERDADCVIK